MFSNLKGRQTRSYPWWLSLAAALGALSASCNQGAKTLCHATLEESCLPERQSSAVCAAGDTPPEDSACIWLHAFDGLAVGTVAEVSWRLSPTYSAEVDLTATGEPSRQVEATCGTMVDAPLSLTLKETRTVLGEAWDPLMAIIDPSHLNPLPAPNDRTRVNWVDLRTMAEGDGIDPGETIGVPFVYVDGYGVRVAGQEPLFNVTSDDRLVFQERDNECASVSTVAVETLSGMTVEQLGVFAESCSEQSRLAAVDYAAGLRRGAVDPASGIPTIGPVCF